MQARTKHTITLIVLLAVAALFVNYRSLRAIVIAKAMPYSYETVFNDVYKTDRWKGGSGVGSNPQNAAQYITLLQDYFHDPRFHKIVDLGCGDWQIMSHINVPEHKEYLGIDVVKSLVAANAVKYGAANIHFSHLKNLRALQAAGITGDLLIVKDVLQHWPTAEIKYFLKNILPNFKYALITNEHEIDAKNLNGDILMGTFRSLDLRSLPFNLRHANAVLEYQGPGRKQVLFYSNPKFNS